MQYLIGVIEYGALISAVDIFLARNFTFKLSLDGGAYDGGGHRTPGTLELTGHLEPRQRLCPRGKCHCKCPGQSLLTCCPRHVLHMDRPALWARDATGSIDHGHRYCPQGHMTKSSFRESVPVIAGTVTHPAAGMVAKIRNKSDYQFGTRLLTDSMRNPCISRVSRINCATSMGSSCR